MLRKMYFDIEAGSNNPKLKNVFPDPKVARHNVLGIVAWDNYKEKYYIFVYRDDLEQKQFETTIQTMDGEQTANYYQTDDERNLILAFGKFWNSKQFDLIHAWNGDNFDIPYLLTRSRNLDILGKFSSLITPLKHVNIDYNYTEIAGVKSFDLMRGAKKILGRYVEGSLQAVSMNKLGVGKLGETVSAIAAHRHDLQRFIDYNVRDVELMVKLDEKMPIFSYFRNQVQMTGSDYISALTANYKACEEFIRYNKSEHPHLDDFMLEVIDTAKQKEFKGAIVLDAKAGVADLIAVHDLAMMYPNIMLSCNMSPETIVDISKYDYDDPKLHAMNCIEVDGVYFRTDFEGFIPKLIRIQVNLRYSIEAQIEKFGETYGEGYELTEEFETLMQMRMNTKNLINSWYGIFGFKNFLLYDYNIAKSVTFLGVKQIEWSRDFVKKHYDRETKYGDTDSIFIDTPAHLSSRITQALDDVYKLESSPGNEKHIEQIKRSLDDDLDMIAKYHEEIGEAITASYDDFAAQYNIKEHSFSMKFEKLYARIFFVKPKKPTKRQKELGLAAKKRYAGLLVYKDGKPVWKLDIAGFPVKRSDTAKITIDCQKAVLEAVVFTANPYPTVYKIVRRYYRRVKSSRLHPNVVGIPKGFGSSLRAYNKAQRTYRWYAAQWANDHLGTNYGKASKPRGVALKYLPPPWNQYPTHRKHKYNWMAFDDENPLRDDFYSVIDWDFMANATIIEPMKSIYESVDIKTSQIKSGTKRSDIRKGF